MFLAVSSILDLGVVENAVVDRHVLSGLLELVRVEPAGLEEKIGPYAHFPDIVQREKGLFRSRQRSV
mgnify:CR=1 FL=1